MICYEVFTACLKLSYRIHLHCFMWILGFEGEKIGKRKINQPQTWLVSALSSSTNELHVFVASKREIVVVFY